MSTDKSNIGIEHTSGRGPDVLAKKMTLRVRLPKNKSLQKHIDCLALPSESYDAARWKRTTGHTRLPFSGSATLAILFVLLVTGTNAWAQSPSNQTRFPYGAQSVQVVSAQPLPPLDGPPTPGGAPPVPGLPPTDGAPIDELQQLLQQPVIAPTFQQEVSIVTGQQSTVGKSPAAVFVVTQEMIRRSGATSIPEVLRTVPGLQVSRVNSHEWTVTARGFGTNVAGIYSNNNKLLVQIDGRSVYSPLISGVNWDVQDLILEDIERIEVVRGPGATIWGENAVNGVINIITKKAEDTQGGLVQAGGGTVENGFASARVGGQVNDDTYFRVYGKWFDRGAFHNPTGDDFDDWSQERGGFRIDWTPSCYDTFTVQGDIYNGSEGLKATVPVAFGGPKLAVSGGNVLMRWQRELADDSDFSVQFYYDRANRENSNVSYFAKVSQYDLAMQHSFGLGCNHHIVWGLGFRSVQDELGALVNPPLLTFAPNSRTYDRVSGYIQDEFDLLPDELTATVGVKLLNSAFADFEYQPSARVLWSPEDTWAAWGAISRAVRTPARVERDLLFPNPNNPTDPPITELQESFRSEDMIAYELGYRAQPNRSFSWDAAFFFNQYENLQSFHSQAVAGAPGIQIFNGNNNRGHGYGVELSAQAEMTSRWHLSGWYSFLQLDIDTIGPLAPFQQTDGTDIEGSSPHHQVFLMSTFDVTCNVDFDLMARYVDNLPHQNAASYITVDARLAWRPTCCTEFSVVGQNLLDQYHYEFGSFQAAEVPRGVFGQITHQW